MNLNKKILALVITTCAFNITNSSYCMNNNKVFEVNDDEFANHNGVFSDIILLTHDTYNKCINITSTVFDNIIHNMQENLNNTQTRKYLSSQHAVPLQKVQEILDLFNTFASSVNQTNFKKLQLQLTHPSNFLPNNNNPILDTDTNISLGKFLKIIQCCITRLKTQTLTALDKSIFSGADIKTINKENAKILNTATQIIQTTYDKYLTIFLDFSRGAFLKQKSGNLAENILAIPAEINKLDMFYYYGSTFQKRFDKLHRLLLSALDIVLEDIAKKEVKNITIHRNASLGNNDNYERINIFNEQNGEYDYYESTAFSEYVFPKGEVSLKEYLNGLKRYLSVRKKTVNENIQKVINKNYILTKDDIKLIINNAYLKPIYWLIRAMNYDKNYVKGNTLPIIYTYIINEFAKYYGLASQYWPPLPDDLEKDIKNKNIRFDKLLDE